jgi:hypothetical protein
MGNTIDHEVEIRAQLGWVPRAHQQASAALLRMSAPCTRRRSRACSFANIEPADRDQRLGRTG